MTTPDLPDFNHLFSDLLSQDTEQSNPGEDSSLHTAELASVRNIDPVAAAKSISADYRRYLEIAQIEVMAGGPAGCPSGRWSTLVG